MNEADDIESPEKILAARLAMVGTDEFRFMGGDGATLLALKRLRWYEERELFIDRLRESAATAWNCSPGEALRTLLAWDREHPKPGEST